MTKKETLVHSLLTVILALVSMAFGLLITSEAPIPLTIFVGGIVVMAGAFLITLARGGEFL